MAWEEKMNVEKIRLEARLSAIEYMIGQLFRMIYVSIGATPEMIEASHKQFRDYLQTMPMPTDDPAISDLAAAEIQEAHERLLEIIETAAKGLKRR
jgi:hypothetical protein